MKVSFMFYSLVLAVCALFSAAATDPEKQGLLRGMRKRGPSFRFQACVPTRSGGMRTVTRSNIFLYYWYLYFGRHRGITMGPCDISGTYTGTYEWTCGGGGSASMTLAISNVPGTLEVTGNVSYLGDSTAIIRGLRYGSVTRDDFGIQTGVEDANGTFLLVEYHSTDAFTNNVLSFVIASNRLDGTSINGKGCSNPSSPGGTGASGPPGYF